MDYPDEILLPSFRTFHRPSIVAERSFLPISAGRHELRPNSPRESYQLPPIENPNDNASRNVHQHDYTVSLPHIATLVDHMSIGKTIDPHVGNPVSIGETTDLQVKSHSCTFPGCTAPPFQTQYLLNSHANVHSSLRPHYCPVQSCPRAKGGKGFKRKNEMIRHGLVHYSPRYSCPFCADREHKYPRRDNLQRHVRIQHPDKSKDDPLLNSMLAQQPNGSNKTRRRK